MKTYALEMEEDGTNFKTTLYETKIDKTDLAYCTFPCNPSEAEIGKGKFEDCTALYSVALKKSGFSMPLSSSASLWTIQSSAFSGCSALRHVGFMDRIHQMGESSFQNCTVLREVRLCPQLMRVPTNCFMGCKKLELIQIPDTSEEMILEDRCFADCEALKSSSAVFLPMAYENVHDTAFDDDVWLMFKGQKVRIKCVIQARYLKEMKDVITCLKKPEDSQNLTTLMSKLHILLKDSEITETHADVVEMVRKRRMDHVRLTNAIFKLQTHAEEKKANEIARKRAIQHMRDSMFRAAMFKLWTHAKEMKANEVAMKQAVQHMRHLKRKAVLKNWRSITADMKAAELVMERAIQHMTHSKLEAALKNWRSITADMKAAELVMERAIQHMTHSKLEAALKNWRSVAAEMKRHADAMKYATKRAIRIWRRNTADMKRHTGAIKQANDYVIRRALETTLLKWISFTIAMRKEADTIKLNIKRMIYNAFSKWRQITKKMKLYAAVVKLDAAAMKYATKRAMKIWGINTAEIKIRDMKMEQVMKHLIHWHLTDLIKIWKEQTDEASDALRATFNQLLEEIDRTQQQADEAQERVDEILRRNTSLN